MVAHALIGSRSRLGIGLALFVALCVAAGGLAAITKQSSLVPLTLGSGRYMMRLATNDATREQGLSGTVSLPTNQGMLFIFDKDDEWGMWMKDMQYPIDILWLDQSQIVVDMVSRASPDSYPETTFRPKAPARYVVELAAGSISDASISIGDWADFSAKQPGGARL